MFTKEEIAYIKDLYENIFEESADNSKEFINFAEGNIHLLRIKVENWLIKHPTDHRLIYARELDTFITNFIENNYA